MKASVFLLAVEIRYRDKMVKKHKPRPFLENLTLLHICLQGLFASYLPAIQEFLASHTKYDRAFKPTPGKR